jgi:hypothetical protein
MKRRISHDALTWQMNHHVHRIPIHLINPGRRDHDVIDGSPVLSGNGQMTDMPCGGIDHDIFDMTG